MADIHQTAIVDSKAEIDDNVKVGPFTIIEGPVKLYSAVEVGSHALITGDTSIGENCRIHHGAVVGTLPQDLKFGGEETRVEIGANTTIREYVTVNRGTEESGYTSVGDNCLLMAYSHVAHDCHIGDNVILANGVQMAGHVHIQDYAIVGGLVAIHQFVTVGAHCMIGGGYRIPKDVCPYALVGGYPVTIKTLNLTGLMRRGFSAETIQNIKKAYKILFNSPYNTSDAVKKIRDELPQTEEINNILTFIANSRRGLIK
ncbi:MAG: acyl-ACP--UDP-N-acetylglucosamine O-acyltransferase [candidate division Zixibacteria bacterium]|nr:acyl-ACP--UDP-N-acetylglucosamine O-acyltransferase [candidate division Zixibacteria bacterium]